MTRQHSRIPCIRQLSPPPDSNRKPFHYKGNVTLSRPFTSGHRRAQNCCSYPRSTVDDQHGTRPDDCLEMDARWTPGRRCPA